jgi:uncharacterized protein
MGQMNEVTAQITSGFWHDRLRMNAEKAIFHQWEMLESTRCIDNFRIVAGLKEGFREGFFFADSDAYKWLDAASRILKNWDSPKLTSLVDGFMTLLEKAQTKDGYLYTYNQIHFGNARWQCLQIEHEFYCLGHLIEAGIAHKIATGEDRLLNIAKKAADLLFEEFLESPPKYTDGHEEIEIALIKLSRLTGNSRYRDLAKHFLYQRGRIAAYPLRFLWQSLWSAGRMNTVSSLRKQYFKLHTQASNFKLPAHNKHRIPGNMPLRFAVSALSGKYAQQHQPLAQLIEPVGHAVRFSYLNTAAAMLARDEEEVLDLPRMQRLWKHMFDRRMSVSGGIGSLPLIEGFGLDYELDPEVVYNETCAALGCMLWDYEMSLLTSDSKYDDLFEWQLYNAASVGIGMDGCSYFYNNPLTTKGGYKREAWYDIPCCPSNLSRAWASLADYAINYEEDEVRVHHYFGGEFVIPTGLGVTIQMESSLPWDGSVKMKITTQKPERFRLSLRKPAWAENYRILFNGKEVIPKVNASKPERAAASGVDFSSSAWLSLDRVFTAGDSIIAIFNLPIKLLFQDKRIAKCGGKAAVSRGPILYCLESVNNTIDFEQAVLVPGTLKVRDGDERSEGIPMIFGKTKLGEDLFFTPYYLWGNSGETAMTVFIRCQV